jgi:hypothetical protein
MVRPLFVPAWPVLLRLPPEFFGGHKLVLLKLGKTWAIACRTSGKLYKMLPISSV